MLRLTERDVRVHADEMRNSNLMLAEHDIRLCSILEGICIDNFLSERLLLKGGTAINKFYLKDTPRFSVDLDFNHRGPKEDVESEKKLVRETIQKLLMEEGYRLSFRHRYEQTTLVAKYKPLSGADQNIKIEISHIERFPILSLERLEFKVPVSDNVVKVDGYKLDELQQSFAHSTKDSGEQMSTTYILSPNSTH